MVYFLLNLLAGTWYYLWISFHSTVQEKCACGERVVFGHHIKCMYRAFLYRFEFDEKKKSKTKLSDIHELNTDVGRQSSTIACSCLINTTKRKRIHLFSLSSTCNIHLINRIFDSSRLRKVFH